MFNLLHIHPETFVAPVIAYHRSKVVFDQFDDRFLAGNTYRKDIENYHTDSFLGHQFIEDPDVLLNYKKPDRLGYNFYQVRLNLDQIAVIDVAEFAAAAQTPDQARTFKAQLMETGFNGVRFIDPGDHFPGRLMKNTLVALSAASVEIVQVSDLQNGSVLRASAGSLVMQHAAIQGNAGTPGHGDSSLRL